MATESKCNSPFEIVNRGLTCCSCKTQVHRSCDVGRAATLPCSGTLAQANQMAFSFQMWVFVHVFRKWVGMGHFLFPVTWRETCETLVLSQSLSKPSKNGTLSSDNIFSVWIPRTFTESPDSKSCLFLLALGQRAAKAFKPNTGVWIVYLCWLR